MQYWIAINPADGSRLGKNKKWYKFVDPSKVKFYKSKAWALKASEKYGSPAKQRGNMVQVSSAVAISDGESLDMSGWILDENGKRIQFTG